MTGPDPRRVSLIDAVLPQTQCRQCGYPGCRPYAQAIADGTADINQCPPGGDSCVRELAALTGAVFKPVDPRFGIPRPAAVAVIDEARCIGCALCIHACPVDAIVGAAKWMHTVIARDCTGCELCIAPCPVACITLQPTGVEPTRDDRRLAADRARVRFELRMARLERRSQTRPGAGRGSRKATVQRAIARARIRLAQRRLSRKF